MKKYSDVAIIGGGPAGIAAAMELKRLGIKALLIEKGRLGGQLRAARQVLDYPGFSRGVNGSVLAERMAAQLHTLDIEAVSGEVVSIARCERSFDVVLGGVTVTANCVVAAVGQTPRFIGLPFEKEFQHQSVWHYPIPDDVPHKGKAVLVAGSGDAAFDQALSFADGGASVHVAIKGREPKAAPRLVESAELHGVRMIRNVNTKGITFNGTQFRFKDMLFDHIVVCAGKSPDLSILKDLHGDMDGCFLAGDCARGTDRHVALAVGDGVAAAYKAKAWLEGNI